MTSEPTRCVWTEDEDGVWHTACGEAFQWQTCGPRENGARFCCYCGGMLEAVHYVEEEDDGA